MTRQERSVDAGLLLGLGFFFAIPLCGSLNLSPGQEPWGNRWTCFIYSVTPEKWRFLWTLGLWDGGLSSTAACRSSVAVPSLSPLSSSKVSRGTKYLDALGAALTPMDTLAPGLQFAHFLEGLIVSKPLWV